MAGQRGRGGRPRCQSRGPWCAPWACQGSGCVLAMGLRAEQLVNFLHAMFTNKSWPRLRKLAKIWSLLERTGQQPGRKESCSDVRERRVRVPGCAPQRPMRSRCSASSPACVCVADDDENDDDVEEEEDRGAGEQRQEGEGDLLCSGVCAASDS